LKHLKHIKNKKAFIIIAIIVLLIFAVDVAIIIGICNSDLPLWAKWFLLRR
jgi:uncharacterized membrane protein